MFRDGERFRKRVSGIENGSPRKEIPLKINKN